MPWDSDPIGNAKWALDNVHPEAPYFIVCYSYGANTALAMCRELQKHNREVTHLFIIDGVKRLRTAKFSWLARAWSLNPWQKLVIPRNVMRQTVWWQGEGRPKGHTVYRTLSSGEISPVHTNWLTVPHVDMEDETEIHRVINVNVRTNIIEWEMHGGWARVGDGVSS